jgi:hypothetical protein
MGQAGSTTGLSGPGLEGPRYPATVPQSQVPATT